MDFFRNKKVKNVFLTMFGSVSLAYVAFRIYRKFKKAIAAPISIHNYLKKEEADKRTNLISELEYVLFLNLATTKYINSQNKFTGQILINFNLKEIDNIFLDWTGKIFKLNVNGISVVDVNHINDRILINKSLLSNKNYIMIEFENNFSASPHGLRLWRDPNDLEEFIYTSLHPSFAHHVFPCFDQPDLLSKIKLFTYNNAEWHVISNSKLISKTVSETQSESKIKESLGEFKFHNFEFNKGNALYEFEFSSKIPVYSFLLTAGQFNVEEEVFEMNKIQNNSVPKVKIYSRKSLKGEFESTDLFKKIHVLVKWMNEQFQQDFISQKLDIVFLPEMGDDILNESFGAVLLDDRFFKLNLNTLDLYSLSYLVSKQIANLWFANVVTPKWWDSLWIKEGLSNLISILSIKSIISNISTNPNENSDFELMRLREINEFNSFLKTKTIIEDTFESTHSLSQEVVDTHMAETLFDYTLHKGSHLMEYLYDYVGKEGFFAGLRNYLKKNSGKSANFNDFKFSFEEGIKGDITFTDKIFNHIQNIASTRGVNAIKITFEENQDKNIVKAILHQNEFEEGVYLRFFTSALVIYKDETKIIEKIEILNAKNTDISQHFIGKEKPLAVLFNYDDKAYFRQIFEKGTIDYIISNSNKLKDYPQALFVFSRDLFQNIRFEAEIDPLSFIDFTVSILNDSNPGANLINQLLYLSIYLAKNCVINQYQSIGKNKLFDLINNLIASNTYLKDPLINYLLEVFDSTNSKDIEYIISTIKETDESKKIDFTEDEMLLSRESSLNMSLNKKISFELGVNTEKLAFSTKMKILETIYESNHLTIDRKEKYRRALCFDDPNFKNHLYIEETLNACVENLETKELTWNSLLIRDTKVPIEKYVAKMKGFARKSQFKVMENYYYQKFFENFIYVKHNNGVIYAKEFFKNLNPSFIIDYNIKQKLKWLCKERIADDEYILKQLCQRSISELKINLKVAKNYENIHKTLQPEKEFESFS